MLTLVKLDYDFSKVLAADYTQHSGSSILHLSANAGMQNKYTMQVSGFLK